MSKLGKTPIDIPSGVEVTIEDDKIKVKGPKGELSVNNMPMVNVEVKDNQVILSIKDENEENAKAYWGLVRSLIQNCIIGVTEGFSKELELVGIGYRVEKVGNNLKLFVGYSHDVIVEAPEGITFDVEGNTKIKVSGIDKQQVGQVAANIRAIRKPEPYKGKGIKYVDEIIRRKQGKAAKSAA